MTYFSLCKTAVIIYLVATISCNSKENANGNIISINDSQFVKQLYRENGKLFSAVQYLKERSGNVLANGYSKEYYETGELRKYSTYHRGKMDSISTVFFKDGTIQWQCSYFDGIRQGTCLEFYPNGNEKRVLLYSTNSQIFDLKYDKDGKILDVYGIPLLVHIKSPRLNVKDKLLILNEVINSSRYKNDVIINFYSLASGNKYTRHIADFNVLDGRKAYAFTGRFNKPAKWVYEAEVNMRNLDGTLVAHGVLRDTLEVVN